MKKWLRVFLICFVLVGGTAFFAYYSLNEFNKTLDNLSALAMANTPLVKNSDKKLYVRENPTSTSDIALPSTLEVYLTPTSSSEIVLAATSTSEINLPSTSSSEIASVQAQTPTSGIVLASVTSATSIITELRPLFIFPKTNSEVYIGCTYQLLKHSSSTISLSETALFDAGSRQAIDSSISGLSMENEIKPNSSLDWKVGEAWPGQYYIRITTSNDFVAKSKVFTIKKMSKSTGTEEKKKICKESGGSF